MPVKRKDLVVGHVYWVIEAEVYAKECFARAALRASFFWQCQGYEPVPMVCVLVGCDGMLLEAVDPVKLRRGVVETVFSNTAYSLSWGVGNQLRRLRLAEHGIPRA